MAAVTETTAMTHHVLGNLRLSVLKGTTIANGETWDTGLEAIVAWGCTQEAGAGVVSGSVSGGTVTLVVESTQNGWLWALGY
ncbi:MAG: hypothetical protein EHM13_04075 [Acidobacteria bacterium]|nr:MAG: hypothetical protein EHM13_04075 [Acidobacteriota bacterium]